MSLDLRAASCMLSEEELTRAGLGSSLKKCMTVTGGGYLPHPVVRAQVNPIPSRRKNKLSAPSSFSQFGSCRIIIDCTDIEVAAPGLMSQQNATYSSYRGMNSFKVIIGVTPNAVITYFSNLYPGSISDKAIVQQSCLVNHFSGGDMILADKGFLIQDILPNGVSFNIPPFLNSGTFTESEAKATKAVGKCHIHGERANARLKDCRILRECLLQWGVNNEEEAIKAFTLKTGKTVKETGIWFHSSGILGASPDGIVDHETTKEEEEMIKGEISGHNVSVIYDGTT
ncbi:uncharacterized protein LOC113685138 [Pocillopora damicornis]|uniref:uncharacterized protein LOC113685138 n=1 Tax=Pocillopora damicornis TaxID=46731 RepID=UPI000F5565BE|nr:uncharacterized protein LOC113685138 [Pocillopora damicornis]